MTAGCPLFEFLIAVFHFGCSAFHPFFVIEVLFCVFIFVRGLCTIRAEALLKVCKSHARIVHGSRTFLMAKRYLRVLCQCQAPPFPFGLASGLFQSQLGRLFHNGAYVLFIESGKDEHASV